MNSQLETDNPNNLFEEYQLGKLKLPSRIIMAPMTRSRVSSDNQLGDLNATYYAQRATAGMIISEAIVVNPMGRGYLLTPGIYSSVQIEGARKVTDAVHGAGGRIIAQLWHVGRVSHSAVLPGNVAPVGPTDFAEPELYTFSIENDQPGKYRTTPPRALDDDEIAAIPEQFANAAANAIEAGFDGIEILAANGYLFEQFQNSGVNTRNGRYGGQTAETRCRLLVETVEAIQQRIGKEELLGVRLSPFGTFNCIPEDDKTEETYLYAANQLQSHQVDYVHFNDEPLSVGHLNDESFTQEEKESKKRLIPTSFIKAFREIFTGTIVICGGLDRAIAEEMLANGNFDLFAFAISYIANPDLVHRMQSDIPLAEPDPAFFYGGGEEGYINYPNAE